MRKSAAGGDALLADVLVQAQVEQAGRESGSPLPAPLRDDFGAALGTDLSPVQLHTGAASATAASGMQAKAFAVGQHIHFGAGAYDPSSHAGRHLLAHEVAHTVQQAGNPASPQRAALVSSSTDPAEREAERFADAFVSGAATTGLVTTASRPAAAIHRYEKEEHHDIPTRHLEELYAFLATDEGKKWAAGKGYDAEMLAERMAADPVIKGEKLHGSNEKNPDGKATEYGYGVPTALMGDLFATWEEMDGASQDTIDNLMKAKSTGDYQKHSNGQYLKLAKNNDDHFAVRNKLAWEKHHVQAIDLAEKSRDDDELFERAKLIEAAGAHFLTDAFAAGHLFEKRVVLTAILMDLAKKPMEAHNPQMQTYVGALGNSNSAQMILKLIHDRMNAEGFEITNGKGMKWRTFGDDSLARSPETQRIAALAVFESRQQVIEARKGRVRDIQELVDEVGAFFPTNDTTKLAEQQAIAYIPEARAQVEALIHAERSSAPGELGSRVPGIGKGLGKLVKANLDTIADPGRERQLLLNQQLDQSAGGDTSTIAPSFTVGRW